MERLGIEECEEGIERHNYGTNQQVTDDIENIIKSKDTILIKGSRGMHIENIVESLREGR